MIPKIIHYCWLSDDPYPAKIQRCIDSWKKTLPDYELRLWNFERLGADCPDWVREAFDHKKYAFAADFVRAYALFHEGGIYLDSDVETIKSFDPFLHLPYFLGRECEGINIEAACMGAEKGSPIFKKILAYYYGRHFARPDGTLDDKAMPLIILDILSRNYTLKNIDSVEEFDSGADVVSILPSDFFSPMSYVNFELKLTPRTVAIHHFAASWLPRKYRLINSIQRLIGPTPTKYIQKLKATLLGSRTSELRT